MEVTVGGEDVAVLVVVDPLAAAHGNIAGGVEGVAVLDDVNVLHAEAVAAAQYGAGVMRLVDVLQHHGDVAGAVLDEAVEELPFVVGNHLAGGLVEFLLLLEA